MKELTYGDVIASCFRFLGINDLEAILDMTPSDYSHLMTGYRLQRLDNIQSELEIELLRNKLSATDKKGKPMYTFKKVFNHEKEVKDVMYDTRKRGVRKETVDNFAESKRLAEEAFRNTGF